MVEDRVEVVTDSNGLVRFDSSTITNKIIMKKKTITIGALLLAMNCFSQTDTLAYSISGKEKLEFDYYTSNLKSITKPKKYQDFKFKLKEGELLVLDLFDDVERDTLYLLYRDVTVYYRNGYVEKLYFSSNDNTLSVDGSLVKKVIVHKPELK